MARTRKSDAQRAKKYRDRRKHDKKKYDAHLKQDRERKSNTYVPINSRTASQQTKQRKLWNDAQKRLRHAARNTAAALESVGTPPNSPTTLQPTAQSRRSRKTVRKDRAAAYRKIQKLTVKLKGMETKMERYKKRYNRLKNYNQASPVKMT